MLSPGSARARWEAALLGTAAAIVAWLFWQSLRPDGAGATHVVASAALAGDLPRLTAAPVGEGVHLTVTPLPGVRERDWLAALMAAGRRVTWSAAIPLAPMALTVEPRNDPTGGLVARFAAPSGERLQLRDAIGALDSARGNGGASNLALTDAIAGVSAQAAGQRAVAVRHDSLLPRDVVVFGMAGWEAKFVMAALEERGWRVSSRLEVAPAIHVDQGAPLVIDTAHVGTVIALDSSAAPFAARLADFVRRGGGLILEPAAAAAPAFRSLAPAGIGPRQPSATLTFTAEAPRRALALVPLTGLRAAALPLEELDGRTTAAAWRWGAGRVVQLGYDDTWRWRMSGAPGAVDAHRRWWTEVVAAAAYRPVVRTARAGDDAMPLASWVAALGAPTAPENPDRLPAGDHRLGLALSALALLLGAWGSRRARGVN